MKEWKFFVKSIFFITTLFVATKLTADLYP